MDETNGSEFSKVYLAEVSEIAKGLDINAIEQAVGILAKARAAKGRLFVLGVGGSAANASHAVNDMRKIAGIEAYTPSDNVAELTARTNDDGWHSVFDSWLKTSNLNSKDVILVLSVGGGDAEKNISANLVHALKYAQDMKAKVIGIVGKSSGYTAQVADVCIVVPQADPERITPHSEAFQAVIWHLFVFHPRLRLIKGKWGDISANREAKSAKES